MNPLSLTVGGRFAVLNVGQTLDSIMAVGCRSPSVAYSPKADNLSHATIWWEDFTMTYSVVAAELLTLLTSQDIYTGLSR